MANRREKQQRSEHLKLANVFANAKPGEDITAKVIDAIKPKPVVTEWNYLPNPARKVTVRVGSCAKPTYWHNGLEGTIRKAVAVKDYDGTEFLIDDEDGQGWYKVTHGGGPDLGHKSLPGDSVIVSEVRDE